MKSGVGTVHCLLISLRVCGLIGSVSFGPAVQLGRGSERGKVSSLNAQGSDRSPRTQVTFQSLAPRLSVLGDQGCACHLHTEVPFPVFLHGLQEPVG